MYTQELTNGAVFPMFSLATADDLDAAPAVHGEYAVLKGCKIKRLMFLVTEAVVADTTAPVIRFSKRVTPGSDSGAVVLGTLTIPHGTAVGKVIYKDIEPVSLSPGDTIKVENTVQTVDAGSGTETGQGYYGFELVDDPDTAANQSDMVASA